MDSSPIVDRFSTHLKNVLTRALCYVVESGQPAVMPEHILWALGTERGCIASELIRRAGVSVESLRDLSAEAKAEPGTGDPSSPQLTDTAKRAIEKAVLTAQAHEHKYVGTEHLLAGLIQIRDVGLEAFFGQAKVDVKELGEQVSFALRSASRFGDLASAVSAAPDSNRVAAEQKEGGNPNHAQALSQFGRELTGAEAQPKLDPVIGREREISRVMEILCRRTKNNPLLVGEPGVGKTAIVEGLAKRIHQGDVPPALRGKRLLSVDLAAMIAGTMYRGEFEQRIRQVIEEARKNPDVILFIDELHTVVGAGAATGSLDAANILKPALARGELRCIGATTLAEFKKHIEPDAALERRFQSVHVDEPTAERTREILSGLAPAYEQHHRVRYEAAALDAAVKFSIRFLPDRRLPDKAVDLMDEAAAALRVQAREAAPAEERRLLERRLEEVKEQKQEAVRKEQFAEANLLKEEEDALRTVLAREDASPAHAEWPLISADDVARVVARMSGLPLTDVVSDTSDPAVFHSILSRRVFGQDSAIKAASRALARAKAGLGDPRRPLASFLFLGPSGVGKTELAKALAEAAFKDSKALIRLDMSEYAEAFTASKLVGAPAGYVGYRDGAKLTDRVKQRPHSVVLFDEIEKAHPDVQNLLLQLLEEGELTDASGVPVSFRNAVIVLTSNAGSERSRQGGLGFGAAAPGTEDLRRDMEDRFRPELLNRIEHVLLFETLSDEARSRVAQAQIEELSARLSARGRALQVHAQVAGILAKKADPAFGARDIRRLVQTEIENPLAELLGRPGTFHVGEKEGGIIVKMVE